MGKHQSGFRKLEGDELARLTFLGASGEVTGSSYLLETASARVLFDCGLCQGERHSRAANERPFPFRARELDLVVLTHAHVDHSGLLPKLVRDGFRGKVHATVPSGELVEVLLRDSAKIHEQDTRSENRRRQRQGKQPVEPLYEAADAERALEKLVLHPFGTAVELAPGLVVRFVRAGHILGAASVEAWVKDGTFERKLVLSGDLGRKHEPLLLPPEAPREADLVLLESTYGDRDHKDLDATVEELAQALVEATKDGGNVLVPVFAVGRAQEILHYIGELERARRIPELPVFLDSPMAVRATELYQRHADCFQRGSAALPSSSSRRRRLPQPGTPGSSPALPARPWDRHAPAWPWAGWAPAQPLSFGFVIQATSRASSPLPWRAAASRRNAWVRDTSRARHSSAYHARPLPRRSMVRRALERMNPSPFPASSLLLGLVLGGCGTPPVHPARPEVSPALVPERYSLVAQPLDEATAATLEPLLLQAFATVEAYFGAPFPQPFTLTILPDRAAFDASFPPEWGIETTECWMVATGVADGVRLLSPRVWKQEACEHDPGDPLHVRRLLAHELVHTYHGQHNPSPDFADVTGIDWFVEGLATLASGQLEDERQLGARDALERGAGPDSLATAWSGRYRYGVSGSLVAFLERELGHAQVVELLDVTTGDELLARIGMSEEDLLEGWRLWVLDGPSNP